MVIKFEPIEAPVLDPRNEKELVELALDRLYVASGGTINDFGPHAPARALTEGLCFAIAELLYYANQLPEAMAINFLQIVGVQRRLGTPAQAMLRVELIEPLDNPFVIPAGFVVLTNSGRLMFTLDSQLLINPGSTQGDVPCTCTELGTKGNVAVNVINRTPQKLAYLKSIFNPAAASGGTDEESIGEVKSRGFQAIRRRGLISKADYEEEVISLLGPGAIALAKGNLGADGQTYAENNIHVFALNADGALLNNAQALDIRDRLRQKSLMTVADFVWVSSLVYAPIHTEVIAKVLPNTSPAAVAEAIYQQLREYFKPGKYPPGEAIILKELEYQVRLSQGIQYLHSVTIGDTYNQPYAPVNFPLPLAHSIPEFRSVSCILQGSDRDYRYIKGNPDFF